MTSTTTSTPATTTPYPSTFQIHVYKETFKFNAAHFVAFDGYRERLHGHNYQVSIRLFGGGRNNKIIGHDGYLLDFGIIKSVTKRVCQTLNEHFLCPMYSDVIDIDVHIDNEEQSTTSVKLTCQDGTVFVFPRNDCILLPIVHATAEEIAVYLYGQILNGLQQEQQQEQKHEGSTTTTTLSASDYLRKQRNIHSMEITVAEAPGQEAIFRYDIPEEDTDTTTTTTAECPSSSSSSSYELDVRKFINNNNGGIMPCLKENENKNKNKNQHHIDGSPSSSSGATATTTTTTGRSSIAVGERGNKGIDDGGVGGSNNNQQQCCCCRCCCNCNNNNCCFSDTTTTTDNNNFTNTRQLLSRLADAINNDGRFFQQQGEQQRVVTVQDLQDILSSS